MIAYPLYLSAYPLGRLIEFQIEQYIKGKNLASGDRSHVQSRKADPPGMDAQRRWTTHFGTTHAGCCVRGGREVVMSYI
jgi:hypothetical protein